MRSELPPPDWRDPENYPGLRAPLIEWAWAFTRRSVEYQRDFQKVREMPPGDIGAISRLCRRWGVGEMRDPNSSHHPPPANSLGHHNAGDRIKEIAIAATSICVEFDLTRAVKPQIELAESRLAAMKRGLGIVTKKRMPKSESRERWMRLLYLLDGNSDGGEAWRHPKSGASTDPQDRNEALARSSRRDNKEAREMAAQGYNYFFDNTRLPGPPWFH